MCGSVVGIKRRGQIKYKNQDTNICDVHVWKTPGAHLFTTNFVTI